MMSEPWPLSISIAVFAVAALVTVLGGIRLTRSGDVLADRTRLGEALFGAVFFGGMISLSGIVMTATAAFDGHPRLGFSNAMGGIAAQTAALGAADLAYRRANLEHAAASLSNMLFAVMLIALLVLALLAGHTADVTVLGIHPGSVLLVGAYFVGLATVRQVQAEPLWIPTRTRETVTDEPEENTAQERSTGFLWMEFVGLGLLVSAAGWSVTEAAQGIVEHTGLDESVVGTVLMGLTNAMPETITSIAAVRRGALTLTVGGVLGGNSFDVLNLVVGDVAYRGGSLYHAAGLDETVVTLVTILMTTILLGGMLRRERQGPAGIGWESILLLVTYVAMLILITWGVNGA
jgi:cation:H+ antiporter